MGKIIILPETEKKPITLMGRMAGVCYGSNIEDSEKNYKRGIECLESERSRAYWEFRRLFKDLMEALAEYSNEWKYIVENYYVPKCEYRGYCIENKSCGRKPSREKSI